MKSNITVGILVFENAEELDFIGPLEVFGIAAEFGQPCRTVVLAEQTNLVRCAHGLQVLPDYAIAEAPDLDLLIVPGGKGARLHARTNPRILQFVQEQKGIVASVCTGAVVLAAAGLLDGLEATTHHSHFDTLREYQAVRVREGLRFVVHERIATSAGVTAGIDLSLALLARFWGGSFAEQIAKNLEWDSSHWRKWEYVA
jgi:transcriptional regulator GlxA family with amidase domain